MQNLDLLDLCRKLIQFPSITPDNVGTIDYLSNILSSLGFKCQKFIFQDQTYNAPVHNLYARIGDNGKNFCFAGHTDVVPVGNLDAWSFDPFNGDVINDNLYGRGTTDMKCAIACFIVAVDSLLKNSNHKNWKNSISLLLTGDEERHAVNGTPKVLEKLKLQAEKIDLCLIGEPSNPNFLGEMIKIGRRGSLNATLEIYGAQGHVAYPEYAHNPIKDLVKAFSILTNEPLDKGDKYFQPSNLEFTSIDVGNDTCNIIPQKVISKFNIRFNNNYNIFKLIKTISNRLDSIKINYNLTTDLGSEPFINHPKDLCQMLSAAIKETIQMNPTLGTTGGTSDARFIQEFCPVIEFGLIGKHAHQINEHVAIKDIFALKNIYQKFLEKFL